MILVPNFMRKMGVGNDPEDLLCQLGYDYFVEHFPDPIPLNECITIFQAQIEAGEVDRGYGSAWLKWLLALRQNPKAIKEGGQYQYLDQYMLNTPDASYTFVTQEEAEARKLELIDQSESLERVQIMKVVGVRLFGEEGIVMEPVEDPDLFNPGVFRIFDPMTGEWHEHRSPEFARARLQVIRNKLLTREADRYTIYRKIQDTVEGYTAWERQE